MIVYTSAESIPGMKGVNIEFEELMQLQRAQLRGSYFTTKYLYEHKYPSGGLPGMTNALKKYEKSQTQHTAEARADHSTTRKPG